MLILLQDLIDERLFRNRVEIKNELIGKIKKPLIHTFLSKVYFDPTQKKMENGDFIKERPNLKMGGIDGINK